MKKQLIKQALFGLAPALIAGIVSMPSEASVITIDPSDDGSLYSENTLVKYAYLLSGSTIQGDVTFPLAQVTGSITQAELSVNAYGLPLWGPDVAIYGYSAQSGDITADAYNTGTYLGTLALPANLGYGQDVFFDVTQFLTSVNAPFVGFNLRSASTDVFSSLEYNYGHPAQLTITTAAVPEPSSFWLVATGCLGVVASRRKNLR